MYKLFPCFLLIILSTLTVFTACGRDIEIVDSMHIDQTPDPSSFLTSEMPLYNDYIVTLEIDPYTRTVQGMSEINFTNRSDIPLDTIVMRVFLNAFQEHALPRPYFENQITRLSRPGWERGFGYMEIQYASMNDETLEYRLDGTILTFILPEPLQPNVTVQILLQYNAYVPKLAHRIGGNNFAMWFGMFLPVLAVHGENGWHTDAYYPAGEPFFVETANYDVTITLPIRYVAVGTGVRTEEIIEDTDTRITHFSAPMTRDFAFAVSPYFGHAHVATDSGIDIHFYYHTSILEADRILDVARRSVEYFETRIGVPLFGQISIVEANLVSYSASFSQVVFIDTRCALMDNLWCMAQGLGNQWFANIIGTNRVKEPWLSNGLTQFIQTGVFYETSEALRERIDQEHAIIRSQTDLHLSEGLAIHTSHAHYTDTQGRKAMTMLYALQRLIGYENFGELIARYYYEFSYGIATTEDFIRIANELSDGNLDFFFYHWMQMGTVPELPVVSAH